MEQRQAFTAVDEEEGVVMVPLLTLLIVTYVGGGRGGRGWHLDSLSFSFHGVAPRQRHRACLLPLSQLCPQAQLPSPAAYPQAWTHAPSKGELGGESSGHWRKNAHSYPSNAVDTKPQIQKQCLFLFIKNKINYILTMIL